jgi:hypothetical protein
MKGKITYRSVETKIIELTEEGMMSCAMLVEELATMDTHGQERVLHRERKLAQYRNKVDATVYQPRYQG